MRSKRLIATLSVAVAYIILLSMIIYYNSIIGHGSRTARFAVELNNHSAAFWVVVR